jgi:hypothetical protein
MLHATLLHSHANGGTRRNNRDMRTRARKASDGSWKGVVIGMVVAWGLVQHSSAFSFGSLRGLQWPSIYRHANVLALSDLGHEHHAKASPFASSRSHSQLLLTSDSREAMVQSRVWKRDPLLPRLRSQHNKLCSSYSSSGPTDLFSEYDDEELSVVRCRAPPSLCFEPSSCHSSSHSSSASCSLAPPFLSQSELPFLLTFRSS